MSSIPGRHPSRAVDSVGIGFVGAGNFATAHLLPHLVKQAVDLRGVATTRPVSSKSVAGKFGFASAPGPRQVIDDESVNAIFIATRHDTHARLAIDALQRGRSVFVEKPLAVNPAEAVAVEAAALEAAANGQYLAVGFDRRFSAPVREIARFFKGRREPMSILYRVNAGRLPADSWSTTPGKADG